MSEKIKGRGRPLGSGNRNKTILGVRVTEEEYEIIKEGLSKLKPKLKKNREIIMYLFKEYDVSEIENKIELNNFLLKLISEELNKKKYRKKERLQLKKIYKEIQIKGIANVFNV